MDKEFHLNKEPLWAIPAQVEERLQQYQSMKTEHDSFKLSALYSAVMVFFLFMLGVAGILEDNVFHGSVLLGIAGALVVGLSLLWLGEWFSIARHYVTLLMGLFCLYLFYTGGVLNTGPLFFGVFPTIALSLQGRMRGSLWVIVMLLITLVLSRGAFGFDVSRYSAAFIARVVGATALITVLSSIPEYFRLKAERDLLLSITDLEALTYGDVVTGLANRTLLEKILMAEFNRNHRYGSQCCLMFIEQDPVTLPHGVDARSLDTDGFNQTAMLQMADILRHNLRAQDVAGRWDRRRFLLVLPEISVEGAKALAARYLAELKSRQQARTHDRYALPATVSIGITAMNKESEDAVLRRALDALLAARRQGGGRFAVL